MAQTEDDDFIQVRVRMRKSLHAQIEKAAEARSTSMNAEIVDRVEKSFHIDRIIGGPIIEDRAVLAIGKMVASVMHDTGRSAAFSATMTAEGTIAWYNNPYAYDQAVAGAQKILDGFRPLGIPTIPPIYQGLRPELAEALTNVGVGFANALLRRVATTEPVTSGNINAVTLLREELGDLVARIRDAKWMQAIQSNVAKKRKRGI